MDIEMLTKEMLKDFYASRGYKSTSNPGLCPFIDEDTGIIYHGCCVFLFPRWAKNITITKDNRVEGGCPCNKLSTKYVVRKTREFYRKNK